MVLIFLFQAKVGIGLNFLCVLVVCIAINTWGMSFFTLSSFPEWAKTDSLISQSFKNVTMSNTTVVSQQTCMFFLFREHQFNLKGAGGGLCFVWGETISMKIFFSMKMIFLSLTWVEKNILKALYALQKTIAPPHPLKWMVLIQVFDF